MITLEQLTRATGATQANAQRWLDAINQTLARYDISTPARIACFIAQAGHESGGLSCTRESFNYTPAALRMTFNSRRTERFSLSLADKLGRIPGQHPANEEQIANVAYAGRMGNGNAASGDGFRYCGRGLGQLTGRDAYAAAGKALGVDLLTHPELAEMSPWGALTFGWFWNEGNVTGKSLNALADAGQVLAITRAINGGVNGATARADLTAMAAKVFGATNLEAVA